MRSRSVLVGSTRVRYYYRSSTNAALILDAALAFAVWLSVPGTGRMRRMPQPLLSDEIVLESRPRSTSQSTFSARYERGDTSPTVEG